MTILILSACPTGLRGHLTRWLLEVAPGVFLGRVTARVRDELWKRVSWDMKDGRALLVFSAQNEQRFRMKSYGHAWKPVDFDGLTLIRRPVS